MGVVGAFLTIVTPFQIYLKSASQVKLTPSFRKPLHYAVNEEEIVISQDDMEAAYPLSEVWKVVDTGKSIVVYVTRVRAYIFPKRDLKDKEKPLRELLQSTLDKRQYRIR
jgi:hypothetical protein